MRHAQDIGVHQEVERYVKDEIGAQEMPYSMPFEIQEGRHQRVFEQRFETVVAGDVLEHFHFAIGPMRPVRGLVYVRHQAAVVELDRVLVRSVFVRLQAVVQISRQRVHRDVRDGWYVEFVHMPDVTAALQEQSHRFVATCPGRIM